MYFLPKYGVMLKPAFFLERHCFQLCVWWECFLILSPFCHFWKKERSRNLYSAMWMQLFWCSSVFWNHLEDSDPPNSSIEQKLPGCLRTSCKVNQCALTVIQLCSSMAQCWKSRQNVIKKRLINDHNLCYNLSIFCCYVMMVVASLLSFLVPAEIHICRKWTLEFHLELCCSQIPDIGSPTGWVLGVLGGGASSNVPS